MMSVYRDVADVRDVSVAGFRYVVVCQEDHGYAFWSKKRPALTGYKLGSFFIMT